MVQLRPYQVEALKGIHGRGGRVLLAYDMGLGKTPTALTSLRVLRSTTRVLVLAPKTAIPVWEREIPIWLPGIRQWTYKGTPAQRAKIWEEYASSGGGILITNFAFAEEIQQRGKPFGTIIVDESHVLRNRKTKLFAVMKKLRSTYLLELTGSPVVNHVTDMWTQLHLLDPRTFSSFWRFARTYCIVEQTDMGWTIGAVRDPVALQGMLHACMIRKTKAEVESDLPPKVRQLLPVPLSPKQRALYDDLAEDLMAELQGDNLEGLLLVPNVISKITRLRQICITPALVGDAHESAMFDTLRENVQSEYDAGRSVMVFTPFAQALPYIQQALEPLGRVWELRGGLPSAVMGQRVAEFQEEPVATKALICTIGVGSSFTATAASTAYFLGSAWAPAHNIQAEDRLHRIGQKNSVLVKYLIGENTIDEHLMGILDEKVTYAALALRPDILLRPWRDRVVRFADAV